MNKATDWVAALQTIERADIPRYLGEHSGLPGPRANLALVEAFAKTDDASIASNLISDGGEYQAMCAAAFLGARADDLAFEALARDLARDTRWRVREGVVIGLQYLGDRTLAPLLSIARDWVSSSDPLVQRAAVAAVCEPRLLKLPESTIVVINICGEATKTLAALPEERRKMPDARTLRQALGYCWSVAIAANPTDGLPAFLALDTSQADIAWIVSENRRKKRLSTLLPVR